MDEFIKLLDPAYELVQYHIKETLRCGEYGKVILIRMRI